MRIGVSGTHSTGKSSLLDRLAEEIKNRIAGSPDLYIIHELARREARDCGYDIRSGDEAQVQYFQQILLWKQMFEESLHQDGFITDRTVFDVLAYRDYYREAFRGWHHPPSMGEEDNIASSLTLESMLALFRLMRYDFLVYLPIEFDEVSDEARGANRNLVTTDTAFREDIDRRIKKYIDDNPRVYGTPITARGSVEERVDTIVSTIVREWNACLT